MGGKSGCNLPAHIVVYDFPQKQRKRILQMQLVGTLTAIPQVQSKLKGRMSQYIIAPYEKVVKDAQPSADLHTI